MERLTVPATLDSLEPIARHVLAAASAAGLGREATYRLRLAVDELATNVITYGFQEAGLSGVVDIWTDIDDKALTVCIEDTAMPYDPTKTPMPDDLDAPLEERMIGGLGVFLARRSVDELRYERVNERNRSILVVNRPGGALQVDSSTDQQGE